MKNIIAESQMLHPELSYLLTGIAFEIHNTLGPGFTENIYQAAFIYELEQQAIPFQAQPVIPVTYKSVEIAQYRLDLIVDEKIVVELKAVQCLNDLFRQQVLSYLKAAGLRLGILYNFGAKTVEHARIIN